MLPKVNRLTKKKDFEQVFKKGKSILSNFLIIKLLKNYLKRNRFGFIVSRKVSNKATIRNKVKRRLRKVVSMQLDKIRNHLDVIIIALPQIKDKKFSEIHEAINTILRKHK